MIQALADVATIALLQQRALSAAETLTEQLQGALDIRILIEQVKGVVAASNDVTLRQAFENMRGYPRKPPPAPHRPDRTRGRSQAGPRGVRLVPNPGQPRWVSGPSGGR